MFGKHHDGTAARARALATWRRTRVAAAARAEPRQDHAVRDLVDHPLFLLVLLGLGLLVALAVVAVVVAAVVIAVRPGWQRSGPEQPRG